MTYCELLIIDVSVSSDRALHRFLFIYYVLGQTETSVDPE
jgi:hypothetical protein